MEITLNRTHIHKQATFGELLLNDHFFCYTIEDLTRPVKVKHETAIPAGRYRVIINMSPSFKRELPLLLNVPNFSGIRIHNGNSEDDSSGCIIVGSTKTETQVLHSKATLERLMIELKRFIRKEPIYITVNDIPKDDVLTTNTPTVEIEDTPIIKVDSSASTVVVPETTIISELPKETPKPKTNIFIQLLTKLIQWLTSLQRR